MIDERKLREMLERRAGTISATPTDAPKTIRRARRRLALNAAVGALVGLAVVAGALAGVRTIQATPTPADPPTPTPTPGSLGALAYGIDGDIYVADWDGANPVGIANGRPPNGGDGCGPPQYGGEGPIWSPDGRYLAYWYEDCQVAPNAWGNVVISDPEGNLVATFPGQGWLISWSPDSTRVAVWVSWGETIGVYGLDGERQTVLTLPPGMMAPGDFDPVWSRDGASLLVPRGVEIPLDGRTPRKLPSDDPRSRSDATYSPDGSRVAYTTNGSLVVAAADGSHAEVIAEPKVISCRAARAGCLRWVQNPVWSPTGDRIAFAYSEDVWTYVTELRVIDLATGTVTSLAGMGGSDRLWVIEFSPEGDQILFSRTEDEGRGVSSLWSIHADGSDPRRLVTGTNALSPVWGDWQSLSQTR
jgi:Tol biopolymer transport system component